MTCLASVTVGVPPGTVESFGSLYAHCFGWEILALGRLDPEVGQALGVSGSPAFATLGAPGSSAGRLRLIESQTPPPPALTTTGWAAIEMTVRDVFALQDRLMASGRFRINGPARDLSFGGKPPEERILQAVGPAGEQYYFLQPLEDRPDARFRPPPAEIDVGPIVVSVLATHHREQVIVGLGAGLGLSVFADFRAPLSLANREQGLAPTTDYHVIGMAFDAHTGIEVDEYPQSAAARTNPAGELPGGIALTSVEVPELERVIEGLRPHTQYGEPARYRTNIGPATLVRLGEALFEIVELGDDRPGGR